MSRNRLEPFHHVSAEVILNDIDDYTSPEHVSAKEALALLREVDRHLQRRISLLAILVQDQNDLAGEKHG